MPDYDCSSGSGSARADLAYRVGGLFGILAASVVGFLFPNVFKGRFKFMFFLFRTFAAGVVLATGFVHVLPDADSDLSSPCLGLSVTYPWANVIATFSALLTFAGEFFLRRLMVTALKDKHIAQDAEGTELADKERGFIDAERARELQLKHYKVVAYTLEAGIIFHSIFVGITLGTSHDLHYVQGLTFALLFHQGFEGIALGSALSKAEVGFTKLLIFGMAFALTTPLGVAIGIGVGNSYTENSPTALGCEGSFNSVAAGILIYNGLVDLIVPAFDEEDEPLVRDSWVALLGIFSAVFGAAGMSIIAKWA